MRCALLKATAPLVELWRTSQQQKDGDKNSGGGKGKGKKKGKKGMMNRSATEKGAAALPGPSFPTPVMEPGQGVVIPARIGCEASAGAMSVWHLSDHRFHLPRLELFLRLAVCTPLTLPSSNGGAGAHTIMMGPDHPMGALELAADRDADFPKLT